MPKLDLNKLIVAGAESVAKPGGREQFRAAFKEAEFFNQNFKDTGYSEQEENGQIRRLDRVLELGGQWLTSKPLKQEGTGVSLVKAANNAARWAALAELCEQCSNELIAMGYRPLFGHWNSDPLQDPGDHPNYWLERLDPQHRGSAALKDRYKTWARLPGSHKDYGKSFFDYVDSDPTAKSLPRVRYDKGTDAAQALDRRKRRNRSMIQIQGGSLHVSDEDGVCGAAYDTVAAGMKTEFAGPGYAIFVWDHKKRLFSGQHIANSLHHSTARGGRPVRCAGELRTDGGGKLVLLTSKTGHYTTTPKEFGEFLRYVIGQNALPVGAFCVPDTSGQALGSWPVYRALEWAQGRAAKVSKDELAKVLPALQTEIKHRNFWNRLA